MGKLFCKHTYESWYNMKRRCATNEYYANVEVCERWKDYHNFLEDMGYRPRGTVLGRKGDMGNYEPGNCEWEPK